MAHGHGQRDDGRSTRPLLVTLSLVLAYMAFEVIGGLMSGSLALLADAGHMVSDAGALALTLFAMRVARRRPTSDRTYGFCRAEILAALANGATLVAIAGYIFVEAYARFRNPPVVQGPLMLGIAAGGLVVNLLGLWLLHGERDKSLNVRGAWLHVLTDMLGSLQAIGAAALIWAFGWNWVDPLASVLIGVLVIFSSWSLLRESVSVLMEGTPDGIDVDEVRRQLLAVDGVTGVHDLHVWTITTGFVALSAHIDCSDRAGHAEVLGAAQELIVQSFGIRHSTIQVDTVIPCRSAKHRSGIS